MNRHDFARPVGKNEHIGGNKAPDIRRRILDGRGVVGGHERFQVWQVCKQFRGACESDFALSLKIAEDHQRVVKVVCDLSLELDANASANHPQRGGDHACGDDEQRNQELGSQIQLEHVQITNL